VLDQILDKTLDHWLALTSPQQRIFSFYLFSALLVATLNWIILKKTDRLDKQQPATLLGYLYDKNAYLHKSARQDYAIFLLNGIIYTGIVAGFLINSNFIINIIPDFLYSMTGEYPEFAYQTSIGVALLYTIAALLCLDFTVFFVHYMMHKIPVLWVFHKVHHSAEVLNPFTLFRQHPVDLMLAALVFSVTISLTYSVLIFLTGSKPQILEFMGINIFVFAYYLLGYNLRHSHIWVDYPRWLSPVLISPAQHQIHHSQNPAHFDKTWGWFSRSGIACLTHSTNQPVLKKLPTVLTAKTRTRIAVFVQCT